MAIYNEITYYYLTNLQGDVVGILDGSGNLVVQYFYNAWGYIMRQTGSLSSTLGDQNPLRYRGYVYDPEYKLYYLESRYYNPGLGRFQNADAFASTGQGLLGNNMYIYCNNNPVKLTDPTGTIAYAAIAEYAAIAVGGAIAGAGIASVSHIVTSAFLDQEVTKESLGTAAGIGALNGAVGAIGGAISGLKYIASGVVSISSGIYAGVTAQGTIGAKVATGVTTGIIAGIGTYYGAGIDVKTTLAFASGFASFAATAFVGTPTEIISVFAQKIVSSVSNLFS